MLKTQFLRLHNSPVNIKRQNDKTVMGLFFENPLHPYISIHILHTVLYTFPVVLVRRICFINNQVLPKSVIISFFLMPLV